MKSFRFAAVSFVSLMAGPLCGAVTFEPDCLALDTGGGGRRREALVSDGLLQTIALQGFSPPVAGQAVKTSDGKESPWYAATWQDGALTLPPRPATTPAASPRGPRGPGYVCLNAKSDREQTLILEAEGNTAVLVNGAWHAGNIYANLTTPVPVSLHPGINGFLLATSGRGALKAALKEPPQPVFFHMGDLTLPDFLAGATEPAWAAIIVVNTTGNWLQALSLRTSGGLTTPCGPIPPMGSRKLGFKLEPCLKSTLTLLAEGAAEPLATTDIQPREPRKPGETRRITFVSEIDGSVQYYGLTPATPAPGDPTPGLVLSLHGASVEAMGQAGSYQNKPWVHIVAPTNRRPYGFDWEDWGRVDAMEVLAHAKALLHPDPRRQYLSGHSMGGHGTWQLGVHFPDRFAAIGPSAGWISFFSYAGSVIPEAPNPVEKLFLRALSPSDTLALAPNYLHEGIYILHGDADDNVPVEQARTMREKLGTFHPDFCYYEQPGANHWWGNQCMDWPRMYEFFKHHQLPDPAEVTQVKFKTASPGVSASCHWATVEQQTEILSPSTIEASFDPVARRFSVTTGNIARFSLSLAHIPTGSPVSLLADGQAIANPVSPAGTQRLWLTRQGDQWSVSGQPSLKEKGPHRMGPFKEGFGHRMVLVYGTAGDAAENAWAMAKARFDAETFWYRGNGSLDIVADRSFSLEKFPDRGVVLYGHAESNSAWASLLAASPVQVRRGAITAGSQTFTGDNLTGLFVYPRPDSDTASVVAISGTGLPGLRATDRLPYFLAGVAWPDYTLLSTDALLTKSAGVLKAGFFNNQWELGAE